MKKSRPNKSLKNGSKRYLMLNTKENYLLNNSGEVKNDFAILFKVLFRKFLSIEDTSRYL